MSISNYERIELVLERMQSFPSVSWEGCPASDAKLCKQLQQRLPGLCADPLHLHSFVKEFSLSSFMRIRKCVGCNNRFQPGISQNSTKSVQSFFDYASGRENEFLRCVACGIYAHRSCVFNKNRILDTCNANRISFEKRSLLQQRTNTDRTKIMSNGSNDISLITIETTDDNNNYRTSSFSLEAKFDADYLLQTLMIEEKAGCPENLILTDDKDTSRTPRTSSRDEDISNIIWTPCGPPAHFAKSEPVILVGIKSRIRDKSTRTTETTEITLHDADGSKVNEEPPLGQSFLNTSKVLQETIFRYFSRSPKEIDTNERIIGTNLVFNEKLEVTNTNIFEGEQREPQNQIEQQHRQSFSNDRPALTEKETTDSERDLQIHVNLLENPNTNIDRHASAVFLENTLKVIRFDALAKTGFQVASGAGNFAGGLAGLLTAGPTGMYIGSKIGTVACVASAVGLILEGPIGVGILAVSVAGTLLAKTFEAKGKRLVTLGDDDRKLMMVRSNIIIDPLWEDIVSMARKSTPSTVKLPGITTNAEKRRRLRDINIISSDESELTFTNKVFLLVSSSLNDKKSHPGHVYRYLMKEYRKRALDHTHERANVPITNQSVSAAVIRATRDDTHAIKKYTTMALLEARPALASSSRLKEMTSSTVENLVFGEVYDIVYQEIVDETREMDNIIMTKISEFQVSAKTDFGDYVSDSALSALRSLPDAHCTAEKLNLIVKFLEDISYLFSRDRKSRRAINADNLLEMVCQHLIVAKVPHLNAEIAFIQEFADDDQLLRGKEGYALVTLQAALHFMNFCQNFGTLFEGTNIS